MWRCKGAFLMYSLAWVVVIAIFGALVGLLFSLFDARQLAGVIAMPAGLMFSTVFYVSLLFTYEGCFSQPTCRGRCRCRSSASIDRRQLGDAQRQPLACRGDRS